MRVEGSRFRHNVAKVPRLHQGAEAHVDPWTGLGLGGEFGVVRAHVSRLHMNWGSKLVFIVLHAPVVVDTHT